jgi:hypothetical protein
MAPAARACGHVFERLPHSVPPDGIHKRQFDALVRQQAQRPGRAPLRRLAARAGHETGCLRAVECAWLRAGGRLAGQGSIQPDRNEPLAHPRDGGHPDRERVRALPVIPARAIALGLQPHACPPRLVAGHARPRHQPLEGVAFLVGQPADVLGFLAHGSLLPQVPLWSDVSHNGPNLSKPSGYPTRVVAIVVFPLPPFVPPATKIMK